jgi:hypothetical protein
MAVPGYLSSSSRLDPSLRVSLDEWRGELPDELPDVDHREVLDPDFKSIEIPALDEGRSQGSLPFIVGRKGIKLKKREPRLLLMVVLEKSGIFSPQGFVQILELAYPG